MNLSDELNRKQSLKFQLNNLDEVFIENILLKNDEGIFNLSSRIDDNDQIGILDYMESQYSGYRFQLKNEVTNPRIYFKELD